MHYESKTGYHGKTSAGSLAWTVVLIQTYFITAVGQPVVKVQE